MQLFPSPATEQKKSCAGCSQLVVRTDCHRNRYGEYICTGCQARGIRFTWPNRLLSHLRRISLVLFIVAITSAVAMLVLWLFYSLFFKLDIFKLLFG